MACSSCGVEGVDGICTMCSGDPYSNSDGFLLTEMEWAEALAIEREALENELACHEIAAGFMSGVLTEEQAVAYLESDRDTLQYYCILVLEYYTFEQILGKTWKFLPTGE